MRDRSRDRREVAHRVVGKLRLQRGIDAVAPTLPVLKAGKLIPIGSTGTTRARPLPDVSTMALKGE